MNPACCTLALTILLLAAPQEPPWPAPVKGWTPVQPGEHPRLLFRKGDVPALREKAQTPEGKKIVARLRELLGGGEAMPSVYNANPTVNIGPKGLDSLPTGAFTVYHAAGFGFLHQLTGENKYADLSRQCLEKVFEGQPDRDERYAWLKPGTGFRLGSVHQAAALAYDFSYEAWPDDFRRRVVREIQDYSGGDLQHKRPLTLETMARANGYPPGSNHYGAYIGGTGIAVLAIRGDPGADDKRLDKVLDTIEGSLVTLLTRGFGDHGWFAEGTHPGRVSSSTGVVPLLQSLYVAAGKDYLTTRPNGAWLTLRWVMEIVPAGGKACIPHRGDYGDDVLYARAPMISHSGEFSQGLGAVPEEQRPAVAWCYENFVEPGEQKIYDAIMYPHHAVYALVNWPIGEARRNPGETLPRAVLDRIAGYAVFRNAWKDGDDVVVTTLLGKGPRGYKKVPGGPILVWGLGMRTRFPVDLGGTEADFFEARPAGGVLSAPVRGGTCSFAADFSGASGAAAVLVMAGPDAGDVRSPQAKGAGGASAASVKAAAGGHTFYVMTLQKGAAPEVKAEGDRVKVGPQTVAFDGKKITFE